MADVTLTLPVTRAVALFEGLFGLVYTTVVMARLVAAYLVGLGEQEYPHA